MGTPITVDVSSVVAEFMHRIDGALSRADTIVARRTVDAVVAAMVLARKYGSIRNIRVRDFSDGGDAFHVGLEGGDFWLSDLSIGVDGVPHGFGPPRAASYMVYKYLYELGRLREGDAEELAIGVYSWEAEHCDALCPLHDDFHEHLGSYPSICVPFAGAATLGRALRLLIDPVVPGVSRDFSGVPDKRLGDMSREELLDVLDSMLVRVYESGYFPSLMDKLVRRVPSGVDVATNAALWSAYLVTERAEALSSGIEEAQRYVAAAVEDVLRVAGSGKGELSVRNTALAGKVSVLARYSRRAAPQVLRVVNGERVLLMVVHPIRGPRASLSLAEGIAVRDYGWRVEVFTDRSTAPKVLEGLEQ